MNNHQLFDIISTITEDSDNKFGHYFELNNLEITFLHNQYFEDLIKAFQKDSSDLFESNIKRDEVLQGWIKILKQNNKNVQMESGEIITVRDCWNLSDSRKKKNFLNF